MGSLQPTHWLILAIVLILLLGAKKLPDAARSSGKSLRIFKSEVREMQGEGKNQPPAAIETPTQVEAQRVDPPAAPRAGPHRGPAGVARHRRRGAPAPLTERRENFQDLRAHRGLTEAG